MKIKRQKKDKTKYNYNNQWRYKHEDVKYDTKNTKWVGGVEFLSIDLLL